MEAKEKKLSTSHQLNSEKFITVYGSLTIPQMIKQFGQPKAILKYAKVEALSGLTSAPTILVERFIDGELFFKTDLVIRGISKSILLLTDYNGIETQYVRHPTYDTSKLIKASKAEIENFINEKQNKTDIP